MRRWVFLLLLFILSGCSVANNHPSTTRVTSVHFGKRISVEGWAVNRKMGAQLVGTDFDIWIDELCCWPEEYYSGGDRGKKVRVSGILGEDHGLPVFIPKEGEPPVQGIPVPEGTDLKKASHRYLLRDATWELLRE
jgi:hypothetical protein